MLGEDVEPVRGVRRALLTLSACKQHPPRDAHSKVAKPWRKHVENCLVRSLRLDLRPPELRGGYDGNENDEAMGNHEGLSLQEDDVGLSGDPAAGLADRCETLEYQPMAIRECRAAASRTTSDNAPFAFGDLPRTIGPATNPALPT
jgi:hypothetical protein